MAVAGLYRRSLPSPPAIEFASLEGKTLFQEALKDGTIEGFFHLIAHFQTQAEPAFCALASLSVVLNALSIDPGRQWKEKVKEEGMTSAKVACAGACAGAAVNALRAADSSLSSFRKDLVNCCKSDRQHMIVSYSREVFKQTGTGHFSPIGGYHSGRDLALILDVARFKYPPHWVPVPLLWEGIHSIDSTTGNYSGYMILTKPERPSLVLFTLSCRDEKWRSIVICLMEDVPELLKNAEIKTADHVLSIVLGLLPEKPYNVTSLVKWIAEVRRADAFSGTETSDIDHSHTAKVRVMEELRDTQLFKLVSDWATNAGMECGCNKPSISSENLSESVKIACCQGAAVLCGLQLPGTSDCKKTSVTTSVTARVQSNGSESVVVSGKLESSDGVQNSVHVVVPTARICNGTGSCLLLHPLTADLLTIMLFTLPPKNWNSVGNQEVREQISNGVATEHLPKFLKYEVENLRDQLRLVHEWCSESENQGSSQVRVANTVSSPPSEKMPTDS